MWQDKNGGIDGWKLKTNGWICVHLLLHLTCPIE